MVIGHADGVVTIDLAEGDDAHREQMRRELGEPYRTMLGHLRHESGHYFWTVLVEPQPEALGSFRTLFGDERADYAEALRRHYDGGPPPEWVSDYVSAYATAGRCVDLALDWARQRETFGRKLAERQVIRHKLAEMARRADVAREYTLAVARRLDAGEEVTLQVSMAKNTAVEAAEFCAYQALQIFGGAGYMRESEVERHYRDVRILAIGGGTTEIMNEVIAARLGL